jgi:hypothetical protein
MAWSLVTSQVCLPGLGLSLQVVQQVLLYVQLPWALAAVFTATVMLL